MTMVRITAGTRSELVSQSIREHMNEEGCVALIEYIETHRDNLNDPVEMFWWVMRRGYLCGLRPRSLVAIEADCAAMLERSRHADNRSRADAVSPARRKGDTEDARVAAEARASWRRNRPGRADAHEPTTAEVKE